MPWARAMTAPASTSEASMAFITPSDWSLGVEGTLAVRIPPSPSATRSVKVPPTSTPRRRFFTRSSLLLGDQPPFRGFLLVDVLAVGLGRQGVAHDAKRADGGDVDGDHERALRRVKGSGNNRCQGAAEDARDLVAEGDPGIAHACAEELSVKACLYAVHSSVSQCEPDHDGHDDQDRGLGVEQPEEGEDPYPEERRAHEQERLSADAIGERGEEGDGEDLYEGGYGDPDQPYVLGEPEVSSDVI